MQSRKGFVCLALCVVLGTTSCASVIGRPALPCPATRPPSDPQTAGAIVEKARELVEKHEAMEAQGRLWEEGMDEELQEVAAQLAAHREAHPDDAQAWILAARLGRLIHMGQPVVWRGDHLEEDLAASDAEAANRLAELQGFLDRALGLEKTNAEAHYWKARLFGLRHTVIRDESMPSEPWDLEAAIREATEAVRLAPEVLAYREALAAYFVSNQQDAAAVEVMQAVSGGRHPYYLLLRQLLEIPVPPGAIALPESSEYFAQIEAMKGHLLDHPGLRVRCYVVAASADEIESFYRAKWPAFRLFKTSSSERAEGGTIEFKAALLRWSSNGLEPFKSEREARRVKVGSAKIERTAAVFVTEMRNLPAELQESTPGAGKLPEPARKLFSKLILVNYRTLDSSKDLR